MYTFYYSQLENFKHLLALHVGFTSQSLNLLGPVIEEESIVNSGFYCNLVGAPYGLVVPMSAQRTYRASGSLSFQLAVVFQYRVLQGVSWDSMVLYGVFCGFNKGE